MKIDDKKLNVDDITFDDMLDGGIEDAVETVEDPQTDESENNEEVEEVSPETSLEADVEAKKEKDEKQEQILAETEIPQPTKLGQSKLTKKSSEAPAEEAEDKEEVNETVVGQVLSSLGYESEAEYEDTPDGLMQLTKDVGNQIVTFLDDNSLGLDNPRVDYLHFNGFFIGNNHLITNDDIKKLRRILDDYFSIL